MKRPLPDNYPALASVIKQTRDQAWTPCPIYSDTQPVPVAQSALWKYKAINRQCEDRVDQCSGLVSIRWRDKNNLSKTW